MTPLLKRLESGAVGSGGPLPAGVLKTSAGELAYGPDGITSRALDTNERQPLEVSRVQMSRSTATHHPLLLRVLRRPPIEHHHLHVELRSSRERLRFTARAPDAAVLSGLPELKNEGSEVPYDELVAMLETALALGAELTRVHPELADARSELLVEELEVVEFPGAWSPEVRDALSHLTAPKSPPRSLLAPNVVRGLASLFARMDKFYRIFCIALPLFFGLGLLIAGKGVAFYVVLAFGGFINVGFFWGWAGFKRKQRHFRKLLRQGSVAVAEVLPAFRGEGSDGARSNLKYRFRVSGGWVKSQLQINIKLNDPEVIQLPPMHGPVYVLYDAKAPKTNIPWLDPEGWLALSNTGARFTAQQD